MTVLYVPVVDLQTTLDELYDEIGCEFVYHEKFTPKTTAESSSSSTSLPNGGTRRGPKSTLLVSTTFICSFAGKPRERRREGTAPTLTLSRQFTS